MGSPNRAGLLPLAILVAALALLPASAEAGSTFNVTRFDDPAPDGCAAGDCSLREAVIDANADSGSTINIPAGHVVLSITGTGEDGAQEGDLDLNADVTIKGQGSGATTVDAAGIDRVFDMPYDFFTEICFVGPTVSISGLTITGGNGQFSSGSKLLGAGGLSVCGNATLNDVNFFKNTAVGGGGGMIVAEGSTLNGDHVIVNQNSSGGGGSPGGGAILLVGPIPFGPLTVHSGDMGLTNSAIINNTAGGDSGLAIGEGGGLLNLGGTARLTNVTVSGNTAGGGGIPGFGGGIFTNPGGNTNLLNTTVAGNTAGEGGSGGNLSTDNLLGGPGVNDTFSIKNTIVAGGASTAGTENCNGGGYNSNGNNLESTNQCGFNSAGDLRNTDPKLGPLADNGGSTQTRALLAGSPAINAANNSGCPGTDQRGITRPQALICDIGAFELVFVTDLAVTKTAPATRILGNAITYTITVTNNGPQPAAGVTLTDTLPAGVPLVSTFGATCSGSPVACVIGDLAPGASTSVAIVARPPAIRANVNKSITNTATVSGTYADPNPANNTASATTRLTAPTLRAGISGVPAGCRSTNFNVRVTSTTTGALSSVRVLLDGRVLTSRRLKSFLVRIPARGLAAGRHTLVVESRGTLGQLSRRTTSFRLCPAASRRTGPRFTG